MKYSKFQVDWISINNSPFFFRKASTMSIILATVLTFSSGTMLNGYLYSNFIFPYRASVLDQRLQ